jgi:hypothetical protein
MAKIIYSITMNLTLTYGSIVGTALCIVGVVYLFLNKEVSGALGMVATGSTLILGRSMLEKYAPGERGGAKPITKPQEVK